jgi:hypothetical protein
MWGIEGGSVMDNGGRREKTGNGGKEVIKRFGNKIVENFGEKN